ncbi:hypothetical protein GR160_15705 [Flavobacterium sp. Sd200]|uniref:hypothetical protein n=1 Tax=Flavobacterium sp. Sd200 TaxID=2692211 RepID=UPI0013709194|nr:hypothetical protein [Flavobacterium sp. Sd200]MXN92674.1 hypothetical protein [Flavobacterium sp. Sd200]
MKKYFFDYFAKWWYSAIGFLLSFFIFIIALTIIRRELFFEASIGLITASILSVFISAIVQLFKRNWLISIVQIIAAIIIFNSLSFFLLYLSEDFYANGLELPTDVKLEKPIDFKNGIEDEIALQNSRPYNLKFVLVNSFQPGIYKYYFWFKPKEKGTVYLKAFEITQNDPLSAERLKQRSAIKVDKGLYKVYDQEFTIYEGDWGQPYGARIEVWFKPASGKGDYKLLQKNYKIEGWMR